MIIIKYLISLKIFLTSPGSSPVSSNILVGKGLCTSSMDCGHEILVSSPVLFLGTDWVFELGLTRLGLGLGGVGTGLDNYFFFFFSSSMFKINVFYDNS